MAKTIKVKEMGELITEKNIKFKYDKTIIEIISLLDKMTPEQRQSVLNFMRSFVN